VTRLDDAYVAQVKAIRARVETYTRGRFLAGQYRDADLEQFVAVVVPVVLASRRAMSALTDSYLAQTLSATLGRKVKPHGPIDTDLLRGVAATEVYARPFVTVRTKLSEGLAFDAAVSAGTARLSDIVLTDLQLAKTHTSRSVYQGAGVTRYIRTLSGPVNCALCYVASTQTYSTDDLMPIHPGCDCGTDVAPRDFDGSKQLAATHEAVENRLGVSDSAARAPDYRKQLIVREHGEIGPVLTVRGQHFSGKSVMDN
jgi:hypothetical protein